MKSKTFDTKSFDTDKKCVSCQKDIPSGTSCLVHDYHTCSKVLEMKYCKKCGLEVLRQEKIALVEIYETILFENTTIIDKDEFQSQGDNNE
jgi:hypothetical protein